MKNILLVNHPAENLGNFWYIMHEMFAGFRLTFFKYIYLIMQTSTCLFVSLQMYKAADMIDAVMGAQLKIDKSHEARKRDIEKTHRRHTRLYMHGMLLISFVKVIMNQYPNLHDLSFIIFFLLMSITMVQNYVEGFYFLSSGVLYSVANTGFLWITWLKRFSGNANFFYF